MFHRLYTITLRKDHPIADKIFAHRDCICNISRVQRVRMIDEAFAATIAKNIMIGYKKIVPIQIYVRNFLVIVKTKPELFK